MLDMQINSRPLNFTSTCSDLGASSNVLSVAGCSNDTNGSRPPGRGESTPLTGNERECLPGQPVRDSWLSYALSQDKKGTITLSRACPLDHHDDGQMWDKFLLPIVRGFETWVAVSLWLHEMGVGAYSWGLDIVKATEPARARLSAPSTPSTAPSEGQGCNYKRVILSSSILFVLLAMWRVSLEYDPTGVTCHLWMFLVCNFTAGVANQLLLEHDLVSKVGTGMVSARTVMVATATRWCRMVLLAQFIQGVCFLHFITGGWLGVHCWWQIPVTLFAVGMAKRGAVNESDNVFRQKLVIHVEPCDCWARCRPAQAAAAVPLADAGNAGLSGFQLGQPGVGSAPEKLVAALVGEAESLVSLACTGSETEGFKAKLE